MVLPLGLFVGLVVFLLTHSDAQSWSAHVKSTAFVPGVHQQPWWPLVRGLNFGDCGDLESLKGVSDHITHIQCVCIG